MKVLLWIFSLVLSTGVSVQKKASCELRDASQQREICLTEDCVKAAATILFSLDRSADPCEDFYQYACGGWARQTVIQNTDRFQMVDKRNQIFIHQLLTEEEEEENIPDGPPDDDDVIAKVKKFYRICNSEEDKRNLPYLQSLVDYTGGWSLSGKRVEPELNLNKRLQILQNQFGLSVLFTWGVVEHNSRHKLAIFAGGWNDAFIETDHDDYLKLMTVFTLYLSQATETHSVEMEDDLNSTSLYAEEDDSSIYTYNVDFDLEENETIVNDSSIDISYDYEDILVENERNESTGSPVFFDWLDWFRKGNHSLEENEISQDKIDETVTTTTSSPITSEETHPSKVKSERILSSLENLLRMQSQEDSSVFGMSQSIRNAMIEVIAFEEKLANITNGKIVDLKDLSSMNISQLNSAYPFLNWTFFFESAFKDIEEDFLASTPVFLVQKEYLKGLNTLVSSSSDSLLINYATWRLLAAFYPNRPQDEALRREQCLAETEDVFAPVLTSLYVKAKNIERTQDIIEQVDSMVDTMKQAFKENLSKLSWISENSTKSAETKLNHMIDLIGYPKYVLNSTWLNLAYKEIQVQDDFLMNIVAHKTFMRQQELLLLYQDYSRGSWLDYSPNIATANAYYSQTSNTMIVPIAMLQPPLFWSKPQSLTFGAFGIIVAHEITHAFDDSGIKYDEFGFFKQLYDDETVRAFRKESDCIRRQYYSFSLSGLEVDGNRTLGENIADHGGLKIAEVAYRDWSQNRSDVALPALDFVTNEQMFYLGYALPWCASHTKSHLKSHVFNDEHAPEKFRVLGPLSNSEDFARAYNCPLGSKLNPKEKCKVW